MTTLAQNRRRIGGVPRARRLRGRVAVPVRRLGYSVVLAAVLVVAGVSCGDDETSSGAPATPAATAERSVTVVIKEVRFVNAEVRVAKGGQVVFDNQDTQPHTATGDARGFDTDSLAAGEKKSVTFDSTGTFAFHCSFHPFMQGTVVVE